MHLAVHDHPPFVLFWDWCVLNQIEAENTDIEANGLVVIADPDGNEPENLGHKYSIPVNLESHLHAAGPHARESRPGLK